MSYEEMNFVTPDGDLVDGFLAEIYFADDGVDGAHAVWIIADPRANEITDILEDPTHPNHEEWEAWDTDFFFYCSSKHEFEGIVKNGSGDGWFILSEEITTSP